jgi:hypothetical protein
MIIRQGTAIVVTLLTLLAGCESVPPDPPKPSSGSWPAPTRAAGTMPTQAEVDAALLSPAEIPEGPYHISTQPAGNVAGLNTSLLQCAESGSAADPKVVAVAVFQGPAMIGPFVAETVTVTSLPAAKQALQDLDRVQANCAEFGGSMPGGIDVTINITPLTMPPIADGTKAFRLTASVPNVGVAVYAHLVVVRIGNVLVQVALMKYTSPSVEETRTLAELAVNKAAKLRSLA